MLDRADGDVQPRDCARICCMVKSHDGLRRGTVLITNPTALRFRAFGHACGENLSWLQNLELFNQLGRGGVAEVWRVRCRQTGHDYAIKVIQHQHAQKAELGTHFLNEAQALGRLHHPHIIRLFDYGRIDDDSAAALGGPFVPNAPYLVMEYASGGTLKQNTVWGSWVDIQRDLLVILDALATAHAHGFVHRDLKPSNILIGDNGLKLADFGLVHDLNIESFSGHESASGTPRYMAPEQWERRWRDFGPSTDLYAVGCLSHWLLTGRPPFEGPELDRLSFQHLRTSPPTLPEHVMTPAGFEAWFKTCLEKDSFHRFQYAADAAYVLQRLSVSEFEDVASPNTVEGKVHISDDTGTGIGGLGRRAIPKHWRSSVDDFCRAPEYGREGLYHVGWPPFMCRESERGQLWNMLRQCVDAGIRMVQIHGPPGVGKTALAMWLSRRAHQFGSAETLRVVEGRSGGEMGGLGGLLRRAWQAFGLDGDALRRRVFKRLSALGLQGDQAAMMNCLNASEDGLPDAVRQNARFAAVGRWLAARSRHRAQILIIDAPGPEDEIWAFVDYLAKRRPSLPLLAVFTSRHRGRDEAPAASAVVSNAARPPCHLRIELCPLNLDEHHALATAQLAISAELTGPLYALTRGNPHRLFMTLRAWSARGWFTHTTHGLVLSFEKALGATATVADLWADVLSKTVRQFPNALTALESAACLGTSFDLREWQLVLAESGMQWEPALLDALLDHGVFELSHRHWLYFCDPQCEQVFRERAIRAGRFEAFQASIVSVLLRKEVQDSVRIVHHALAAARYDDYLSHIDDAFTKVRRADRYAYARRMLIDWAHCLRRSGISHGDAKWLNIKLKWAEIASQLGELKVAFRHAAAVARVAVSSATVRIKIDALYLQTLAFKWVEGQAKANLSRIETARQMAHESGDVALICRSEERYGVYLHTYGFLNESKAAFEEALSWHALLDDGELGPMIHLGLARLHIDLGELEIADQFARAAANRCDEAAQPCRYASIRLTLSDIARRLNEPERALDHCTLAVDTLTRYGAFELWAALGGQALAYADLAQPKKSLQAIEVGLTEAKRLGLDAARYLLFACSLRSLWSVGDVDAFDVRLRALLDLQDHTYAQIDSADSLRVALDAIDEDAEPDRWTRVATLLHAQLAALGFETSKR